MSWRSFVLASSLLAASSTAPLLALAQSRVRETGTFQVSQHVLWIRGTDQGVVQLFVARGFRDALARPHNLNPDAILSWSDSLAKLRAARRSAGKEIVLSTTGLASDGTVLQRHVGGRFPGLSITVGGGETLKFVEAATPAFTVALEEAVRATREFSSTAAVVSEDAARAAEAPPVAVAIPTPAVAPAPAASAEAREQQRPETVATAPSASLEEQPVPVALIARAVEPEPVRKRSSAKASVPAKAAAKPVQKRVPAKAPPAPVVVAATPEVSVPVLRVTPPPVAQAPPVASNEPQSPPAASIESRGERRPDNVEATPSTSLGEQPVPVKETAPAVHSGTAAKRPSVKTSIAARAATKPAQKKVSNAAAEPVHVPAKETPPAPVRAAPRLPDATPVVAIVPKRDSTPSDKKIDLPLGELVIPAALLNDRNGQVQYCYRQVGFKYDSQLAGQLIVRVTLGDGGTVSDVKVIRRNWDGVSAGEVESCIRALIREWTFRPNDPSLAGGSTEFTFTFKP
ncbi:MAG: AgmX/PglI C-terminal domain-containing protein [Gemmatimonadaceae bacterium]